uniref:DNA-directed primase/polymerase protein n=1 Tax=Rhabditophanes sp. KR3021 TaxID=114890 RepID=A0AC35TP90_9BILA
MEDFDAHKSQIDKIESLFETFYTQKPAIEKYQRSTKSHRIFSYQVYTPGNDGIRKYIATDYRKFKNFYLEALNHVGATFSPSFYELITEGAPCRLYFDLEYTKDINQEADPSKLLKEFECGLRYLLFKKFHIETFDPDVSFLVLDATTATKFSQHIIVHLPKCNHFLSINKDDDWVFASNVEMKHFTDELWHLLIAMDAAMIYSGKVNETNQQRIRQPFFDRLVYTKNRNFRLYKSTKLGKTAPLKFSESCKFYQKRNVPNPSAYSIFRDSLCLVPPPDENHRAEKFSIFPLQPSFNPPIIFNPTPRNVLNAVSLNPTNQVSERNVGTASNQFRREPPVRTDNDLTGMYPHTEQFILNEVYRGRLCSIAKVQWYKDMYISVTINGSKYCEVIGRDHKNNGIYCRVFPQLGYLNPYCFDKDCIRTAPIKHKLPYLAALEMRDECIRKFLSIGSELSKIIGENQIEVQQQVLQQSVFQPNEVITIYDDASYDSFNESLPPYHVPGMDETNTAMEVGTTEELIQTAGIKSEIPNVQQASRFFPSQVNRIFPQIPKKNVGYI